MQSSMAAVSGLMVVAATAAFPASCVGVDANVEVVEPHLVERVCEVAERSAALLAECGLSIPPNLSISLVPEFPDACLGLFHCGSDRISLLTPTAFESAITHQGLFAGIPVETYYDSVVTHEMAHAAYGEANCPFSSCPVATEYIGYTMQIRSLPEAERQNLEARIAVDPDEARSYLSSIMLAMAPQRFAEAAWVHLQRRKDPCAYIGQIAAGEVVLDREVR